jgi:hypothetical protein
MLLLSLACSGSKADRTTRTVHIPTYVVVTNPNPAGAPDPMGQLYGFDSADPVNLTVNADAWNAGTTTALLSMDYVTDGTRQCLDLGFQIGFQWESISAYLTKQGGTTVFNFANAKKITLDVKGDYTDPADVPSLTLALIMENGAWYSKSAPVTTEWATVEFTMPAPGSVLVDDEWGNKVFDGWIWSSWTTFDVFDAKDITQVFISVSPAVGGPYHVRYDNLALAQ